MQEGWNLDCPCALRDPTPDIVEDASRSGLQGAPGPLESEESRAQLRFGS